MEPLKPRPDDGAQVRKNGGEVAGQHGPQSLHKAYALCSSAIEPVEGMHGVHGLEHLLGRGLKREDRIGCRIHLLDVLGRRNEDVTAIGSQNFIRLAVGLERF